MADALRCGTATVIGVSGSAKVNGNTIHGFACVTAGTLTIADDAGTPVLTAFPVAAGTYYILPFLLQTPTGGVVTLAGGASGTLAT